MKTSFRQRVKKMFVTTKSLQDRIDAQAAHIQNTSFDTTTNEGFAEYEKQKELLRKYKEDLRIHNYKAKPAITLHGRSIRH